MKQEVMTQTLIDAKDLHIRRLDHFPGDAKQVPHLLDQAKLPFQAVDVVNWPDYPYCPQVAFRIAYTDKAILIHYKVTESDVRAVATKDNGRVWEDACVEFFIAPEGDSNYYNFEFNCIGRLLLHGGAPGSRNMASDSILSLVERWTSLGTNAIDEQPGAINWELTAIIPYEAFFLHNIHSMKGKQARGNFYKCGDHLKTPHFLSWSPIHLEKPMFHCPEYFGVLQFD
ncbi:carbohydrate-binding family 9-like protein [Niabella soli]|uniref:Carbohydrate-binding domain-containing protein n=1 Tax=Niabella soli DSM 19437 TaxID=929713 RepID=W0EZ34_9BACT|nr:carbohydrate-binding family 9-like protein [Niabella soli]AHF16070.1 hypothetical protein NIASO_14745 [Niabella soli DSM 19437]